MPKGLAILRQELKECRQGYKGCFNFRAEGSKNTKTLRLTGDIPFIPKGCTLVVTYEKRNECGYITEYGMPLSERNISLLSKQEDFDFDDFKKKLSLHKLLGIRWEQIDEARKNPYGIFPFDRADEIFYRMGRAAYHTVRLDAITKEVIKLNRGLRKDSMTVEEFFEYVKIVEGSGAYPALKYKHKLLMLGSDKFVYEHNLVKDKEIMEAYEYVSKNMHYRCKSAIALLSDEAVNSADLSGLDAGQKDAIKSLATTKPAIITGGAGSGKTTVISALINVYETNKPDGKISLLAPTGRASRRLAEVTGKEASTIHRGLRLIPGEDGELGFSYFCAQNKIDSELVIVDESSMIDILLMARLLKAVGDEAKIIFVGDHQQLMPVGVGEPFFDFLTESADGNLCEVCRLTNNHRQGKNDIAKNAKHVLDHEPLEEGIGVAIRRCKTSRIPDIAKKIAGNGNDRNNAAMNPSIVQIISPFNGLNDVINNTLRKKEKNSFTDRFSMGDKVIAVHNAKEYCNGDVGFIVDMDELGIMIQFEDGRRVFVDWCDSEDIQLAYSITVHKMQGSECKRVYLFLPKDTSEFVEERLLYTAVTRAKDELCIFYYDSNLYAER